METRTPHLGLAAASALIVMGIPLSGCADTRHADCAYTGEPGSAQYERDLERAARNNCKPEEIVPYEG